MSRSILRLALVALAVGAIAARAEDEHPASFVAHPTDVPYWISGQANFIFQWHPGFRAPYSGENSLSSHAEHALSRLFTLYVGLQPAEWTEVVIDAESAGGSGISDALGLGGFTNLDVVRNPTLSAEPYLARAWIRQIVPLGPETAAAERGPLSMPARLPVRRLELRVGKLGVVDFFDVNSLASDSHLQFMNWTVDNDGAYDYAADTRGYTYAAMLEFEDRAWGVRFAEALMPKVANGPDLQWDLRRARAENLEVELRPELLDGRATVLRLLGYVNHANMGSYAEAIRAFLAGRDPRPTIEAHRRQGRVKYGFGINGEQEVTEVLRIAFRAGWNEGRHESFAYTEVNDTVELAADLRGTWWGRAQDKLGVALVTNGLSALHRRYLALGGLGFILGDGRLRYGRENLLESYYTIHVARGLSISADLQYVVHPGYNRDRGPVVVPGWRVHVDF